ncbi:LysE family translocator [Glaesserella sp.]|uniref:LysE family translocator n=1 Tax=Glaesserella sp. TaxID=2094731 RepID=UPI0035A1A531
MYGVENYLGFIMASIVLNLTPGADTLYILTRSIGEGWKSGIMSALGILVGIFLHIVAVSLGLSQVVAHSPVLFALIKYAGAAYLIYLGVKAYSTPLSVNTTVLASLPRAKIFRQGVITNVLNPKVILFFLALLLQFVSREVENSFIPFMLLGLTFLTTSTLWCLFLVLCASPIGNLLRNNSKIGTLMNRICGTVFMGLGLKIALEK